MTPYEITEMSAQLSQLAPRLRARILHMINSAESGHPGGSLSVIDILSAVMIGWGQFRPHHPNHDWLVLAKGHSVAALYTVLTELGYLDESELMTYRHLHTRLQGHPDRRKLPAVQVTTGHLGQGLSIATGITWGEMKKGSERRVYAVLGEGDLHEGQTWEAAMAAAHYHLYNLIALVDLNGLTQHGPVSKVMNVEPLPDKWQAFGWQTREIDGHNYSSILEGLQSVNQNAADIKQPSILLCHTVKGKGVSFMENDPLWHSRDLPDDLLDLALSELGVA